MNFELPEIKKVSFETEDTAASWNGYETILSGVEL